MEDTTSYGINNIYGESYQWTAPLRVDVIENDSSIEFIYKQYSLNTYTVYTVPSQDHPTESERVFKIVFSCVDGKWHKSDRIFGKIIPAEKERYEF